MVDDAILSREAAYIYQYAVGFSPVGGNLMHWRGIVEDRNGQPAELDIRLPTNFPHQPPVLTLAGSTTHPRADSNGEIRTRSIQQWTNSNHVYNVIREAKTAIRKGTFQSVQRAETSEQESNLSSQLSSLRTSLSEKKDEYNRLQSQSYQEVAKSQDLGELIEDTLVDVENEAYALEEAYDNLEMKAIDFAKQFIDARKRYYLIESSKN